MKVQKNSHRVIISYIIGIHHAKKIDYRCIDILGHRPWPDTITIYF